MWKTKEAEMEKDDNKESEVNENGRNVKEEKKSKSIKKV